MKQALNVLTLEQHELLVAVFKDCKGFYLSRKLFDQDFKILANVTLDSLYAEWKRVNVCLASGDLLVPELFPNFSIAALTTPSGVQAYRQLVGIFSRLEKGVDPLPSLNSFSARIANARGRLPDPYVDTARRLIASWLGPAPDLGTLFPKHGPGAVAEGYSPIEKVNNTVYFRQLDAVGGSDLLHLNQNHKTYAPLSLKIYKHGITRVISVPKDFSKPRIISAEPCTLMFLQQGVARYMMARCEANCRYLNFRDQTINGLLAREHTRIATLDMSNASDTVSRRMVAQLFPEDWKRLLFCLRSHFAKMPDGTIVPIRAFAPMGSALCFPVESIVFAAATAAVLLSIDHGKYFSKEKRQLMRVYGDDIIVPVESARAVISVLTATGFEPNLSKCCYAGSFRESCGYEWFQGVDVTVLRPRSLNPLDCTLQKGALTAALPMVMHANRLYNMGFLNAACLLASRCKFDVAIGGADPYANPNLPWPKAGDIRWNKDLQRCEQRTTVPVQVSRSSFVGDGYSSLLLGLTSHWQSEQVLTPRNSPKRKWVLAAPLSER